MNSSAINLLLTLVVSYCEPEVHAILKEHLQGSLREFAYRCIQFAEQFLFPGCQHDGNAAAILGIEDSTYIFLLFEVVKYSRQPAPA